MMQNVQFILNGNHISVDVPSQMMLIDLLRDKLHLTGTKESCREGECGACTVMLDGKTVNSCLVAVCS